MSDTSGISNSYEPEELHKIENADWDEFAEGTDENPNSWKDSVFGVASRLDNAVFLENVTKNGKWLFKPYTLREKAFAFLGIKDKHWYEKPKKGPLGLGLIAKVRGKDD